MRAFGARRALPDVCARSSVRASARCVCKRKKKDGSMRKIVMIIERTTKISQNEKIHGLRSTQVQSEKNQSKDNLHHSGTRCTCSNSQTTTRCHTINGFSRTQKPVLRRCCPWNWSLCGDLFVCETKNVRNGRGSALFHEFIFFSQQRRKQQDEKKDVLECCRCLYVTKIAQRKFPDISPHLKKCEKKD